KCAQQDPQGDGDPFRMLGGEVTLTVTGCSQTTTTTFKIRGQNPPRQTVINYINAHGRIYLNAELHIACLESGHSFNQFDPVSGLPLTNSNRPDPAGIFQLITPRSCDNIWDWQRNVTDAVHFIEDVLAPEVRQHISNEPANNAALALCNAQLQAQSLP